MPPATSTPGLPSPKPISLGVTCWRWEWHRARLIAETAAKLGVTLQLSQRVHGLHRDINCLVSGQNVDRFVGEFVRRC